ncbi:MAG: hypothetical protein JWM91_331 [Rhodospirillales bacterium]|nr:hypothetical protein [Rhodospirillales bacterium]
MRLIGAHLPTLLIGLSRRLIARREREEKSGSAREMQPMGEARFASLSALAGAPVKHAVVAGGSSRHRQAFDLFQPLGEADSSRRLRTAFTPSQPVRTAAQLIGRASQLERAVSAIVQDRSHVVIFGERGRGKTSLANVVGETVSTYDFRVIRHACDADSSFGQIVAAVLAKVPARLLRRAIQEGEPWTLPAPDNIGVVEATNAFCSISAGRLLVLLDEFDRISSLDLKRQFVELMKNLSDAGARVTFLLVGVAQTLDDLLFLHRSIQRSLIPIHLPLLTQDDIEVLIRQGERMSGLSFTLQARSAITSFSVRSPYFAQLLCLHSGKAAVRAESATVEHSHVRCALQATAEELAYAHEDAYTRAVGGAAGGWKEELLYRAATRDSGPFGEFTAADLRPEGNEYDIEAEAAVDRALANLVSPEAGCLLRETHASDARSYSFSDPAMRLYILLRYALPRETGELDVTRDRLPTDTFPGERTSANHDSR